MFLMTLYFIVSYSFVGTALLLLWRRLRSSNTHRWACVLLLVPLVPYALVEVQTALFGRVLAPAARMALDRCSMCAEPNTPILTQRVMKITPLSANVYVSMPCVGLYPQQKGKCGLILYLHKKNGEWAFEDGDWAAVWSDCGSAEGNTFPPYPDGF